MSEGQLIFFPDYRRTNPYQTLLYRSLPDGWSARAGDIETAIEAAQSVKSSVPNTIFHLNWTPRLFHSAHDAESFAKLGEKFLSKVREFQSAGGSVVWTIHNRLPHHCPWPGEEALFRADLAEQVDIIHLHSMAAKPHITQTFPLPNDKIVICPHGHYIDCYKGRLFKKYTRRRLKFDVENPVFGCIGQLRLSKGIDDFIEAAATTNIQSIIAGKVSPPARPGDFKSRTQTTPVRCIEGFLKDKDLFDLITLTDWAVLPYREILTSGSILLAASLNKPVIVPKLDALSDWTNLPFVMTYPPEDKAALTELLNSLKSKGRDYARQLGLQAFKHASQFDWKQSFAPLFDRF